MIGLWLPELTQADRDAAAELSKKPESKRKSNGKRAPVSDYVGSGILHRVLANRGMLGEQIEPGKWRCKCPRESEHSKGEPFDSSTVYYEPSTGGELGYIHCSHANSGHDRYTLKEWIACFEQSDFDRAREELGISIRSRARSNGKRASMPNDDLWAGTNLNEPPHDADGVVIEQKFHKTEAGNALRFIRDHGENVLYCNPQKAWYLWNGKYWQRDDTNRVVELMKQTIGGIFTEAIREQDPDEKKALFKFAFESEKARAIHNALTLASTVQSIVVLPNDLDDDPNVFCCANGTFDFTAQKLRKHQREDRITKISPAVYDPEAKSELWDKFLADLSNNDPELAGLVQRAFASTLIGHREKRNFFFLYGTNDTSKSTLLKVMATLFGTYHVDTLFDTWLVQSTVGGNRSDLVSIVGARFIKSVETRKGAKFDVAVLKRVTGGDPITESEKYERKFTFHPLGSLWLAANDAPEVPSDDSGFWSRLVLVPCLYQVPKENRDPHLAEKLTAPEHLSAVFAWVVRGLRTYQANGIGTCAAVQKSSSEYRANMDRIAGFFEDCCVFGKGLGIGATELRKAYEAYCEQIGKTPLRGNDFAKALRERDCTPNRTGKSRGWEGIGLVDMYTQARALVTAVTADDGCYRNLPLRARREEVLGSDVIGVTAVTGSLSDPDPDDEPNEFSPEALDRL